MKRNSPYKLDKHSNHDATDKDAPYTTKYLQQLNNTLKALTPHKSQQLVFKGI